jgi:drug/metabolite transporter (DMT)-like permease
VTSVGPRTETEARHEPAAWAGVVGLLVCAVLWSLNGPLIKLLADPGMQPAGVAPVDGMTIACLRSLIGGLAFLPLLWGRRQRLAAAPMKWRVTAVLLFTLMTVTFVVATARTAAANAIILQYTSPVWVFVLAPLWLGERPQRREGGVLLLAMVGVAIIFAGNPVTELRWLAVALASGFGYGALTVALRALKAAPPVSVAGMNALGSGLILLPAALVLASFELTGRQWGLVLVLGLVQFTLPYVIFSWALQRVRAHQAALIVLIEALLNPLLTWVIVGEAVPPATLVGGPLILLSVGWWLWLQRRSRAREAAFAAVGGQE